MTTRRLVVWIAFLAVFAMAARVSMDTDTWWHLRAGEWIIEHRAVPQVDPFSYTRAGAPWQYPGWLMEIPMAVIYRALGPAGMNLWTAGMVTLAFGFLWPTLRGGPFLRAFVLILAAATSGVYWAARPYLATFVLTAVFLWILEDFRWGRANRLLWLPPLMVLWANAHGGFIVGWILWGGYLLDALLRQYSGSWVDSLAANRRMLTVGALLMLAVVVNPSGPVMLLYPFKTVAISALQDYIQEWQSPDFHNFSMQPFLWLLFLTLGAVGISRRRLAAVEFLLLVLFAYLAFTAGRNIALFALIAPPVLTRHLAPLARGLSRRIRGRDEGRAMASTNRMEMLNLALLGLVTLAALAKVSVVLPAERNWAHFRETLPVHAAGYLEEARPTGRLFNPYNWGGYLLWALPEYPVFVDGRTDLYDDRLIQEWLQIVRAEEGWEAALDRWGINVVLLERPTPLGEALTRAGWVLAYEDDLARVFLRAGE